MSEGTHINVALFRGGHMANATLKSVNQIIKDKSAFFIRSYQRGYRWEKTQIQELLADLFEFTKQPTEKVPEYCLQPIIVKPMQDGTYELVDGQQRFTALWLITQLRACITRRQTESYSLDYENKAPFTQLINDIEEESKTNFDIEDIYKKFSERKDASLDSCMLLESIEAIINYHLGEDDMYTIIPAIYNNLSRIIIIWYELEDNESPVEIFTNINANKIRLTNAELIKAVLLRNISDDSEKRDFANEWENTEKLLNNDKLWYFISGDKGYITRIDLLFNIWNAGKPENPEISFGDQQYRVFRAVCEAVKQENALKIWAKIKKICESITDWYEKYELYHLIGLLTIINKDTVGVVTKLYQKYDTMSKPDFEKYVISLVRDLFIGSGKKHISTSTEYEALLEDLQTIVYDDSDKVYDTLLLYNIALLVNANNEHEHFPFSLFKNNKYDIEHINPQTPKLDNEGNNIHQWLVSYQSIIDDPALNEEIDTCLANSLDGFETLASNISTKLNIADNDCISNLVLLDRNTNRGYKNDCFNSKRKRLIEIERTKAATAEEEKYIPIGTKWVFLKGYENADNFKVWGANDAKDYIEDIAKRISGLLGG